MIRAERLRAGLTQQQLAAVVQLSTETIRKYEAGERTPSRERLIAMLGGLQVPPSRSTAVLLAAGYAPNRSRTAEPRNDEAVPSVAAVVEKAPWPRLAADELLCVVAANRPFAALLELERGFQLRRTRAQLNLVAMLLTPGVASHLRNLDECLCWIMGALKSRLAHGHAHEPAAALADEVLAECIAQQPGGARRIIAAWEAASDQRRHNAASCPFVWVTTDGWEVRLVAVETRLGGVHGQSLMDLHPADAESHGRLEAIVEAGALRAGRETARPMRQALRP